MRIYPLSGSLIIIEICYKAVSDERASGRNGEHTALMTYTQKYGGFEHAPNVHASQSSAVVFPVCSMQTFVYEEEERMV